MASAMNGMTAACAMNGMPQAKSRPADEIMAMAELEMPSRPSIGLDVSQSPVRHDTNVKLTSSRIVTCK